MSENKKKKVTGIGGLFFKCKDPDGMKEWYSRNLGLITNEYGSLFEFRNTERPEELKYVQWSPMKDNTAYYAPSKKKS